MTVIKYLNPTTGQYETLPMLIGDSGAVWGNISGDIADQTDLQEALKETSAEYQTKYPEIVDINGVTAPNAKHPQNIPTYVGQEVVHPSVLYFPEGWNGYRYWMMMTPYPGADDTKENPSIVASQDGSDWIVPPGAINPLVPDPGGSYFNSDPFIFMEEDIMHCVYKLANRSRTDYDLMLFSSEDGINWTTPVSILNDSRSTITSPSILNLNGQWVMFTGDSASNPNRLYRRTASSLEGPWSAPVVCDITMPPNKDLWHMEVREFDSQTLHMLVNTSNPDTSQGEELYLASSTDGGFTWSLAHNILLAGRPGYWDRKLYKASMLRTIKDGVEGYDIWYGSYSAGDGSGLNWRVGRTFAPFSSKSTKDYGLDIMLAGSKQYPWYIGDLINRSSSTTSIGKTSTAQDFISWGGTMGIDAYAYYAPVADNNKAVVDSTLSDGFFSVRLRKLPSTASTAWMIFRGQDTNNYWRLGIDPRYATINAKLEKVVSGSSVEVGRVAIPPEYYQDGIILEVSANLSHIIAHIVGTPFSMSTNDSTFVSATYFGVQTGDTQVRYDRFMARYLVDGR